MIITKCDECDVEMGGGGSYTYTLSLPVMLHGISSLNSLQNRNPKHFCSWRCIKDYAERQWGDQHKERVTAIN